MNYSLYKLIMTSARVAAEEHSWSCDEFLSIKEYCLQFYL